jgi:lipoyl-dependent peroxiredoxin
MKIFKHASAIWNGAGPAGTGSMTLGRTGEVLPFSLKSRIGDVPMTNPEELIGAAHAGCFSMALSSLIEEEGKVPGTVETSAKVTLEQRDDGFWITEINLTTRGSNQSLTSEEFITLAEKAKETCPVSKLYSAATITLDAALN